MSALDDVLWIVEINEGLHDQAIAEVKALRALNELMPCGHLERYVVQADEGTAFCALCELEAARRKLLPGECICGREFGHQGVCRD